MTEFAETASGIAAAIRNAVPNCQHPSAIPVRAFCVRGCHTSFYRKRCLVCEGEIVRKNENQLVCGKRRCRKAL
jgi:hypothetical protein